MWALDAQGYDDEDVVIDGSGWNDEPIGRLNKLKRTDALTNKIRVNVDFFCPIVFLTKSNFIIFHFYSHIFAFSKSANHTLALAYIMLLLYAEYAWSHRQAG